MLARIVFGGYKFSGCQFTIEQLAMPSLRCYVHASTFAFMLHAVCAWSLCIRLVFIPQQGTMYHVNVGLLIQYTCMYAVAVYIQGSA